MNYQEETGGEMKEIYVVVGANGIWEAYTEWLVAAYETQEAAELHVENLHQRIKDKTSLGDARHWDKNAAFADGKLEYLVRSVPLRGTKARPFTKLLEVE